MSLLIKGFYVEIMTYNWDAFFNDLGRYVLGLSCILYLFTILGINFVLGPMEQLVVWYGIISAVVLLVKEYYKE